MFSRVAKQLTRYTRPLSDQSATVKHNRSTNHVSQHATRTTPLKTKGAAINSKF